jgi:hypothetical protein
VLAPFVRFINFLLLAPQSRLSAIERRACSYLANLFPDNDNSELAKTAAKRLFERRHEISLPHKRFLFWHDVFPEYIINLLGIGGEWYGFNEQEVVDSVERKRRNPFPMAWRGVYVPAMALWFGRPMMDWTTLLGRYRELEDECRQEREADDWQEVADAFR